MEYGRWSSHSNASKPDADCACGGRALHVGLKEESVMAYLGRSVVSKDKAYEYNKTK